MNFSSGELSPAMEGRIDLDRYTSGVKMMRNWVCLPQGGARTDPGTMMVAAQGDETHKARMVGFAPDNSYMIEVGHQYMRFFKDRAAVMESADAYTKLLLHGDGADASTGIVDSSPTPHVITAYGGLQIDTGFKKWGSGAILFNGTDAYATIPDHADFDLSGGIWTIDFQIRPNSSAPVSTQVIYYQQTDSSNFMQIDYTHGLGMGTLNLIIYESGVEVVHQSATAVLKYDQWNHVAFVGIFSGGNIFYLISVDGAVINTIGSNYKPADYTGLVYLGSNSTPGNFFKGSIDELRGSNGVSRWTTNSAPPTQAYPLPGESAVYSISSPYLEEDLPQLRPKSSNKELFLFHPRYAPRLLTCISDSSWVLETPEFVDGPYEDEVISPTITPSHTALGLEKVTNGAFDTDSGWTKGGNWTISTGKARKSAGAQNNLSQDTGEVTGETYKVKYTLDSISGGSVTVSIGGVNGAERSAAGTYIDYITATGTGDLTFTPSAAGVVCVIDDVSVINVVILTASASLFTADHVGMLWGIKYGIGTVIYLIDGSIDDTANWVVMDCTLARTTLGGGGSSGDQYFYTIEETGSPQRISKVIGSLVNGRNYRITIHIKNGTGTWAGASLKILDPLSNTIISLPLASSAGWSVYSLMWAAVGTTNYIVMDLDLGGGLTAKLDQVVVEDTTSSIAEVWGSVLIDSWVSPTQVRGIVKKVLGSATVSAGHRQGSWSNAKGWPASGCFHEGRLLYLGNDAHPCTVWGSKSGNYTNFSPGILEDNAYYYTISALNAIMWGESARNLCLGANNREAVLVGAADNPISPTSPPVVNSETSSGSAAMAAARADRAILFAQRAGKRVMEFAYQYQSDSFQPTDLTILAEHITGPGIGGMAFQGEPYPVLWVWRTDGLLIGCTYRAGVVGWHTHPTDGAVESVDVVPCASEDETWMTVRREVNGVVRRFVEVMDWGVDVHCGIRYSGVPVTTIAVPHLEGKTVQIVGDGMVYDPQVIPGTPYILTISPAASDIVAGLGFSPKLITNRPEVQAQGQGTSQGLKKRWNKIMVRVLETEGIKINGQVIAPRSPADPMDSAIPPSSEDLSVDNLDWDTDGRVTIEQPFPLPAHVICVTGTLVVGDA